MSLLREAPSPTAQIYISLKISSFLEAGFDKKIFGMISRVSSEILLFCH